MEILEDGWKFHWWDIPSPAERVFQGLARLSTNFTIPYTIRMNKIVAMTPTVANVFHEPA